MIDNERSRDGCCVAVSCSVIHCIASNSFSFTRPIVALSRYQKTRFWFVPEVALKMALWSQPGVVEHSMKVW